MCAYDTNDAWNRKKWSAGELPPTTGSAYLSGFDVGKDPEEIHRLVGYCPQFDALFETLTGREHLELYAAIKVRRLRIVVGDEVQGSRGLLIDR